MPDFFHNLYARLLSLTASSVSLFHHHVVLCLALPLVLPHTASVSSNKQSFNPFHIDSRSPSSLLSTIVDISVLNVGSRISHNFLRNVWLKPNKFLTKVSKYVKYVNNEIISEN